MKALVFPGQGSQYRGMGRDLCERFAEARELAEVANSILGYRLTDIMFEGDEDTLKQTRYTQPAIFLHSVLAAKFIDRADVMMTAGHSLGEYTAVYFAGALSFEDALYLVQKRGDLMQKAGEELSGAMAAIIGLPDDRLETVLAQARPYGVIQAANFNSPGQVVLSGAVPAIKQAVSLAKTHGAKIAKELAVSGAFHSPLMKPAEEELAKTLNEIDFRNAEIPICMNVSATLTRDAEEIRENLILQLTRPVLWTQSIQTMIRSGIREFVEVGPQKVLQGLIKRIDSSVSVSGVETAEDALKLQSEVRLNANYA
ncbi:MAG: ACP S-malonyltransferase [Chloroherpetonaceae bacterium]|nr:ACP S-malonyltransferase [Chloroherpetonaceae bacterium]MDW8437359.1 ACP S-malonyltransferase [Chloroherpetonaceae bacterium]